LLGSGDKINNSEESISETLDGVKGKKIREKDREKEDNVRMRRRRDLGNGKRLIRAKKSG